MRKCYNFVLVQILTFCYRVTVTEMKTALVSWSVAEKIVVRDLRRDTVETDLLVADWLDIEL